MRNEPTCGIAVGHRAFGHRRAGAPVEGQGVASGARRSDSEKDRARHPGHSGGTWAQPPAGKGRPLGRNIPAEILSACSARRAV